MKTKVELEKEFLNVLHAIYREEYELECLPKCDYSYENEKRYAEEYRNKIAKLNEKLTFINKQLSIIEEQNEALRRAGLPSLVNMLDS